MRPDQLNQHWRELYEERAAIKTWDAGMPKEQAEKEALAEIIELMQRRTECRE
jgi:hypothetical protein